MTGWKDSACRVVIVLLAVGFALKTVWDYHVYSTTLNSAPFWIWIVMNLVYCALSVAAALLVAWILKKKKV